MECFELGHKVLQIVFAIRECVQADTVLVIRRQIFQPDSVPPWLNWWQRQVDLLPLEGCLIGDRLVVNRQFGDRHRL